MARAPKPDDYLELPAHALGDEPALAHLTGTGLPTFRSIYLAQRRSTPRSRMYLAAAIAAVASGPFAIVGALTGTGVALSAFVIIVVFAPLVEEMLKVAGALLPRRGAPLVGAVGGCPRGRSGDFRSGVRGD